MIKVNLDLFKLPEDINSKASSPHFATITREDDGFYLDPEGNTAYISILEIAFFLDMGMKIILGHLINGEKITYLVESINFPKLRVNFNGHRIKTTEKNINWSKFYMPIEEEIDKCLVLKNEASGEKIIFDNLEKIYTIGADSECDLKGMFSGKLRYSEEVGWMISSAHSTSTNTLTQSSLSTGYIVPAKEKRFKLYLGMQIRLLDNTLEVYSYE